MLSNVLRSVAVLALLAGAACGDSDDSGGSSPSSSTPTSATPMTNPKGEPIKSGTFTVTPSTGLKAGQSVTVAGTGWNPGDSVGVAQCAAGTVPGPALRSDCAQDTAKLLAVTADGTWKTDLPVTVGAVGPGGKSCNAGQKCVVMAQTLGLTQAGSVEITLG